MDKENDFKIDIDKSIASKNAKLAKILPKFVKNYIKKIVHQDEINDFLKETNGSTGLDFVEDSIKFLQISYNLQGEDNIPEQGRFIFAANHPLGGLESLVLMSAVSKKHPDLSFVVNDILMILKPLKDIFIPINKYASTTRESLNILNETFKSDKQVLFFPAGLCSRKINGEITDPEWKKSFISKAIETQRDIIPVYIEGRNSNFFYRLSSFRKAIGIKINIEMLFLVNEMFKQKNNCINLKFGKPISYSTFDKSKSIKDWTKEVREITYSLKDK